VRGRAGPVIDGRACDIMFDGDGAAGRAALEALVFPCGPKASPSGPGAVEGALRQTEPRAVDVIVQHAANRHRQLLIADMDSTMITVECIDELADYAGLKSEVSAVTDAAMRGELDFAEALRSRVALLAGLSEATVAECLRERVTIMGGAIDLISAFRRRGGRAVLVSGGFTHFTDSVARAIGFDRAIANRLIVKDGTLTGDVEWPIVDAQAKRATLITEAAALGIALTATVAIGDGANDIPMIETAGLGIAYHAKPKTEAAAAARVRAGDLSVVRYALGLGGGGDPTPAA
jgi:phosphoserine phosphatase